MIWNDPHAAPSLNRLIVFPLPPPAAQGGRRAVRSLLCIRVPLKRTLIRPLIVQRSGGDKSARPISPRSFAIRRVKGKNKGWGARGGGGGKKGTPAYNSDACLQRGFSIFIVIILFRIWSILFGWSAASRPLSALATYYIILWCNLEDFYLNASGLTCVSVWVQWRVFRIGLGQRTVFRKHRKDRKDVVG